MGAIIEGVPPGGKVLDIGCAQATAAILLAERGYDVTAVDADPHCLEYARRRYEFGKCRFVCVDAVRAEGLDVLGTGFDGVILGEVLEHVPRPRKLLQNCLRVLQPGGVLVITTPNGESPHNWLMRRYDPASMEVPSRASTPSGLGGRETHLFNFQMRTLLALLQNCGFTIRRRAYLNSYIVNPVGLHRLLSQSAAAALNRFCARMPVLARYSTMTLFVVAQKANP
jgi:2-polyprenyl-6-hydroxyphenyl methylase/3-demethylubiquinone-9 3-methyltransferase